MEEQAQQLWYTPYGSEKTYLEMMGGLVGNFGLAFRNGGTVPAAALEQLQATQQLLEYMTQLGSNSDVRTQLAADLQAAGFDVNADTVAETLGSMLEQLAQANGYESTGDLIAAGVGVGMTGHDYSTEGKETVDNVEESLNDAAGINSPAARFVPTGQMVAAGIGEGLMDFDFSSYAAIVADNILTAVRNALGIHSPSDLFADRVGTFAAAGIGEGFLKELPNQAAIIGNAARHLPEAVGAPVTNNYTRSYDDHVSLNVEEMVMHGDVDAQALAQQIADIGRRNRRARGSR